MRMLISLGKNGVDKGPTVRLWPKWEYRESHHRRNQILKAALGA